MNILRLILQNLRQGTASYRLPHTHQCTSSQYRGLIQNNPDGCVGCGACAYVCPTAAIVVTKTPTNYTWSYEPGKCTFCGRCIDRCKPGSLSMESKLPPLYSQLGELDVAHEMEKKKPAPRPAPVAAVATPVAAAAPAVEKPEALAPAAPAPSPAD